MTPIDYVDLIRSEKYCSVCMQKGLVEPHHINQIGMGRDRKKQLVEHYSAIPVCRQCHTTYHNIGIKDFQFKYEINVYELAHHYLSKYLMEEHYGHY